MSKLLWKVVVVLVLLSGLANCAPAKNTATPEADAATLQITGAIAGERTFTAEALRALGTRETAYTNKDGQTTTYTGVSFTTLLAEVGATADATTLIFAASDGYEAQAPLADVAACAECIVAFQDKGGFRVVLQDITLDLPAGAVTAILGPNGSGKTTLLHLILGLLTPQRGRISLDGARADTGEPHMTYGHRRTSHVLGLVPQEEPSAFNLNVLETVLLGRAPYLNLLQRPSDHDYATAFRALETVGMAALWDRPVPALSGGERQLVILARALTQEPTILLLDEPTSHLDVGNARRILSLMRDLPAQGQTVIFTTHDPNAAATTADHVVLMRQGRVLRAGAVAETLTADYLSATYDVPIDVLQDRQGRLLVVVY